MLTAGVDIGGTKIAAGIVGEDGQLLASVEVPTEPDPLQIEHAVVDCLDRLASEHAFSAVGVAAAGFVSPQRDRILFAPNIAWRDYPLQERLNQRVDLPIIVENDANAAGWAEFKFGAGREVSHMVMITVGTGLGGAIIVNSQLVRGAYGVAGEIGHLNMVPHGHYCGCGHEGCWEMYASGNALTRAARQRQVTQPERTKLMEQLAGKGKKLKGQHVTAAAALGDSLACELLGELGQWLGQGAAGLAAILDPELVILGGGVATAGDLILQPARASFARYLSARGHRPEANIVTAVLGNEAGMIGAADLARQA